MKRNLSLAILTAAGLLTLAGQPGFSAEERKGPPKSLDKYYPPVNRQRPYTLEMLELGRLMGSLTMDVRALPPKGGKNPAIAKEVEAFAAQYEKVSAMVPEWGPYFPKIVVANLKKAAAENGERATLEPLMKEVETNCTHCHVRELFRVQALYHWPRFAKVAAKNARDEEVPFHDNMIELSNRMSALPTSVARGDFDGAALHQKEIMTQFGVLEASCENCHQEPREYFVDRVVKGELMKMGGLVKRKVADQADYKKVIDAVSARSCIPCHQLHMPAAYMQAQLDGK
ncbi:MAG: hypothetical protein HY904_05560 [Deltaproteobacteria bacterium]|nr:hypothetical protein [Deltaproteobacteria bacterium]